MHRTLTRTGYILKKDKLDKKEVIKIKKDLTVKPFVLPIFKDFSQDSGNNKPYKIYLESQQRLIVPRFYGIKHFGTPLKNYLDSSNTTISDTSVGFNDIIKIKPHQKTAYDKTVKHLKTVGGGVLSLPCGYGKTVIALKIICTLKTKTIVVVNKEFLMDQWIERINQFIPDARIGIIQRDRTEVENCNIIIAMIHSLSQRDYTADTFKDIKFAIVDEVHHASARMFSKSLQKITCQYQLGLSATPNRKDGLSYVFYYYLGDLFHSEKRSGSNQVIIKQIEIASNSTNYEIVYNTIRGKQFKNSGAMLKQICDFEIRNKLILEIIKNLAKDHRRKILILSDRREHIEYFCHTLLPAASIRNDLGKFVTYGLYYGKSSGTRKQDHKKMLETTGKCDLVLGTCAMASEALDIPSLNTLIMATPMKDVEQASGRILRKFHKDLNPLIIDLVDDFGNFKTTWAKERVKYFSGENYQIELLKTYLDASSKQDNNKKTVAEILNYVTNTKLDIAGKHIIGKSSNKKIQGKKNTTNQISSNKKNTKLSKVLYSKSLGNLGEINKKTKIKSTYDPHLNSGKCLL